MGILIIMLNDKNNNNNHGNDNNGGSSNPVDMISGGNGNLGCIEYVPKE